MGFSFHRHGNESVRGGRLRDLPSREPLQGPLEISREPGGVPQGPQPPMSLSSLLAPGGHPALLPSCAQAQTHSSLAASQGRRGMEKKVNWDKAVLPGGGGVCFPRHPLTLWPQSDH